MTTPHPRIDRAGRLAGDGSRRHHGVADYWWQGRAVGRDDLTRVGTPCARPDQAHPTRGRWAALVGIGFGAVFYAILIANLVLELIDRIELHQ